MLADSLTNCACCVVFTADTEAAIVSAKTRVDIILDSAVESMQYTHFLSVPLNAEAVQTRFAEFAKDSLAACASAKGAWS